MQARSAARFAMRRIAFSPFWMRFDESQSNPGPLKHVCHLGHRIILISA
jgi:hypothetical protein